MKTKSIYITVNEWVGSDGKVEHSIDIPAKLIDAFSADQFMEEHGLKWESLPDMLQTFGKLVIEKPHLFIDTDDLELNDALAFQCADRLLSEDGYVNSVTVECYREPEFPGSDYIQQVDKFTLKFIN